MAQSAKSPPALGFEPAEDQTGRTFTEPDRCQHNRPCLSGERVGTFVWLGVRARSSSVCVGIFVWLGLPGAGCHQRSRSTIMAMVMPARLSAWMCKLRRDALRRGIHGRPGL